MRLVRVVVTTWLMSLVGPVLVRPSCAAEQAVDRWWLQPQRMVQTNLREIDAAMLHHAGVAHP